MDSFEELFSVVKEYCKTQMTEVAYKIWIKDIEAVSFDNDTVVLGVSSEFKKNIVTEKYKSLLSKGFEEALGFPVEINIVVVDEDPQKQPEPIPEVQGVKDVSPLLDSGDYDYTFDTFIVGSSNKFAHAAALAVATHDTRNYNPLFIHGDSGLGKTHLLFAIMNEVKSRKPDALVIYVKGEQFTNELIAAIGHQSTPEFREKYRKADYLLVDDIQFIAGRDSTQEEFFHTFNTLYESKRQIVLTSDRSPKEMQLLDDRLQTRFEWGLLVDVQPPDFETRLAIVKNKAAQWGSVIDDDIAKYIAENVSSNVRQLEGAMNKILAYRDLIGKEMDEESANRAVRDMLRKSNEYIPTAASIIDEVSRFFGIDEAVVKGPSRSREAVTARQAAMYLVRRMTNLSTPDIGREFGGRDHTTVLHALEQVETKLQNDPGFAQTIKDITININSKK